ncbi:hypothetical protein [Truepera radiovictrix]|uniref:Uncharacterized protein n=1 Tax=Truepera radiovictrix (strain DSM 17093 / CIP 108686 / LMG 22925 / RQ-24) TaxID=649638 RepID=D7CVQ4_TRURR|nr:hypothetical protein [Truepera radiovictrix]ADI15965.1 hypothetical protein Trad_2866 [Truepera radiovictrix DSM 17093]WMT58410.1 hypothetical protein RCV51_05565 [Truepera radiovictrix]
MTTPPHPLKLASRPHAPPPGTGDVVTDAITDTITGVTDGVTVAVTPSPER